ncbi:MAG: choice-of-anchor J domain-containing protein, partial [Flavobacteriales bacterium]|nr:choice-of-anchor J domain-containing protein [Flavobacteriales bacterium]
DWSFPGGNPSTSSDKYPNSYYDSPGTYDVSLTVSDGFTAFTNNKVGHVFVADPVSNYLPIQEGFETMIALSDDWGIINPDQDNISWKLGSVGATGSVSAMLENVNNTNPNIIDELVSPGVDLSPFNSAAIEFKYAYARKTASDNDKLIFRVSTDCGYSWDLLWVGTGNTLATAVDQTQPFVPSTDDWQTQTINVPTPFLEEGFIYKFQFISGGGNNIYLDDINISGTYKDTPILYQPADGAKVYSTDVKIDWKALGGLITYEYQVALDPNFNSLVSSGIKAYISANPLNSDTEELLSGLTIGQKYYWRVRGGSNNGLTNWSQTWEFEPAAIPLDITEQQFTEDINLYPNPANAMVNISGKTLTNYSSLVLRNGLGQTIKMIPINQNELITVPLENLVSGLYFFEFVAEHQTSKVLKFIKE